MRLLSRTVLTGKELVQTNQQLNVGVGRLRDLCILVNLRSRDFHVCVRRTASPAHCCADSTGVHILRCPSRTWWRSRSIPILTDFALGVVGELWVSNDDGIFERRCENEIRECGLSGAWQRFVSAARDPVPLVHWRSPLQHLAHPGGPPTPSTHDFHEHFKQAFTRSGLSDCSCSKPVICELFSQIQSKSDCTLDGPRQCPQCYWVTVLFHMFFKGLEATEITCHSSSTAQAKSTGSI